MTDFTMSRDYSKLSRHAQLQAIWKKTHRDFRGKIDGERSILVLRDGGTCLVRLQDLTDDEVRQRLPR